MRVYPTDIALLRFHTVSVGCGRSGDRNRLNPVPRFILPGAAVIQALRPRHAAFCFLVTHEAQLVSQWG